MSYTQLLHSLQCIQQLTHHLPGLDLGKGTPVIDEGQQLTTMAKVHD